MHVRPVDAAALLRAASDVTLLGHVNPDPDAVGSALALGMVLRRRGAAVRVSFGGLSTLPESLRGLDTDGLFCAPQDLPDAEPMLVTLDTPTPARLGELADRPRAVRHAGGAVLVVDHHASHEEFGTQHVVDVAADATTVLVLDIIDALDEPLDAAVADCLYAGLMTDTSGFARATSATHRMAARLVEAGADTRRLNEELSGARPFAWLPMLAAVLSTARLDAAAAGGRGMVAAVVSTEAAADVRAEDVESVIDVVRATREAEVAVVLKEQPAATGQQWTVSLRSRHDVDVAAVARSMGGGGHLLAAGCTMSGTAEAVLDRLTAALAGTTAG